MLEALAITARPSAITPVCAMKAPKWLEFRPTIQNGPSARRVHENVLLAAKLAVLSDAEIFGRYQHARARRLGPDGGRAGGSRHDCRRGRLDFFEFQRFQFQRFSRVCQPALRVGEPARLVFRRG